MSRTVLVTGATRGLGLSIAGLLLEDGYTVVGTGRSDPGSFQALMDDSAFDGRVHFAALDLAEPSTLHDHIKAISDRYGPIWGLVNNGALARAGVLATLHEADIQETIAVNVTGTIVLTKYAVRAMLPHRGGRVVNIASIVADTGYKGLSAYGASKSALVGFGRSLAREVGKAGITVNTVAPGYMRTQMSAGLSEDQLERIRRRSPLERLIEPEEVAAAVSFLLSDRASGITGTTITVDAGSTA